LELIYDRFGLEFYPSGGVQFKDPMMLKKKFLCTRDVSILAGLLYLAVGNFTEHTGKSIRANDTQERVTTRVEEQKDGEYYKVSVHFEFTSPTQTSVGLCEALDYAAYHVILNQYDFTGRTASRRVIRCEEGQGRVEVTEEKGIVKVDATIRNVNGIQIIG